MSLKLKTVLTSAILLASLAASSLSAAPAAAVSAETISAGKAVAEANGIVLDSDADAAELAVLNNINGGVLPEIEFRDDETVSRISGPVSDLTVRSKTDAKAVIRSVAGLLGIENPEKELSFFQSDSTEYTTCYTFRQVYRGIRVEGASVTVFADASTGKTTGLNSTFASGITMDLTPAVPAGEVRNIVRDAYNTGLQKDPELVILCRTDGSLTLAYEAAGISAQVGTVYVSAADGSMLSGPAESFKAATTYTYNKSTANPVTGTTYFTINNESYIQNSATRYRLHDTDRNIYYIGDFDQFCNIANPRLPSTFNYKSLSHLNFLSTLQTDLLPAIRNRNTNSGWYDREVGILYQVERAHDYYKNNFGWDGTDGSGSALYLREDTSSDFTGNAAAYPNYNVIEFGIADSEYYHGAREIGIVAHEFTHRVMLNKVQWGLPDYGHAAGYQTLQSYIGEQAVLNEGYADVMGEYAQYAITGTMEWKNGNYNRKDGNPIRDYTKNAFYREYFADGTHKDHYYRITDNGGDTAHIEAHDGSTIISHIAYLMDQAGIYRDDAQKIWFQSMQNLRSTNYSFKACRTAVTNAANTVINNSTHYSSAAARKKAKVKVHSAFNFAKIFPNTSYRIGDINNDGYVDVSDAVLVARYVEEPGIWTSDNRTPQNISKGDVNYDGYITDADRQKILRVIARLESFD